MGWLGMLSLLLSVGIKEALPEAAQPRPTPASKNVGEMAPFPVFNGVSPATPGDGGIAAQPQDSGLPAGARIKGRVVDSLGSAISGVRLEVRGSDDDGRVFGLSGSGVPQSSDFAAPGSVFDPALDQLGSLGVTEGQVPPISTALAQPVPLRRGARLESGPDGGFLVSGVPAGRVRVLAYHPGYAPARSAPIDLLDEEDQAYVTLSLPAAGWVTGRITNDKGEGLENIQVALSSDAFLMPMLVLTDEAGDYRVGPVAGPCTVRAQALEGAAVERSLEVPAGEVITADLTLVQGVLVLAGRVLDEEAQAVAGAALELDTGVAATEPRHARSDQDGSFRFAGLAEGHYRLSVEAAGYASQTGRQVDLPGEQPVRIILQPGLTLRGAVFDARSGQGLAAQLSVAGKTVHADNRGFFQISNLSSGNHEVLATHPGFASGSVRVTVEPHLFERPTQVQLALSPGSRIEGTVVDRLGAPAQGARVAIMEDPAKDALTDGEGHFALSGLTAGTYRLLAVHSQAGRGQSRRAFDLRPGEEATGALIRLDGQPSAEAEEANTQAPRAELSAPEELPEGAPTEPPRKRMFTLPPVEFANQGNQVVTVRGAAGVQPGDRVLRINGDTVYSAAQARAMLRGRSGSMVTVVVSRGGGRRTLRVRRP